MSQLQKLDQNPIPDLGILIRRFLQAIINLNVVQEGGINSVGSVTLSNGATTTTLRDNHITPACKIFFWPQTANAAGVASSLWYDLTSIPVTGNFLGGQITLNHSSAAHADLTFGYVIFV